MGGFDVRASMLPTVTTALLHASIVLLEELHKQRGYGPWVDEVHKIIVRHLKNQDHAEMSPAEEVAHVDAAVSAIDALFSTVYDKYRN